MEPQASRPLAAEFSNQAAALLFGGIEGLPNDITALKPGQFIYRDGRSSDTVAAQAALVTFDDIASLARLTAT